MRGNIIELRLWNSSYGEQVASWYESGDYPMYFRCLSNPPLDRSAFANFPQMVNHLVFGIFDTQNNFVGLCDTFNHDINSRTGETGIMVDKKFQNMGIAADCSITMGRWLFEEKNLRKVIMQFSGSDEYIKKIMNKFASMFDPKIKMDDALERNPFFEGRKKKHVIVGGRYVDIVNVGVFKNQFEKGLEKIKEPEKHG